MSPSPPRRRTTRIAAEIVAMFAALVAIDAWLFAGTAFAHVQPNPLWLPVLVFALAYGTGPGVVAAAVASGWWLLRGQQDAVDRDYLDHLFHLSMPPLLWFVAAAAIGEVTIVRAARRRRVDRHNRAAARNVARMTEAFEALSATNRRLQVRIATEGRTTGHVVATASGLAAADPAERRAAVARLVALAAETEDFTCYRIAGDEARAWLRGKATAGRCDLLPVALIGRLGQGRGIVHVVEPGDRAVLEGVGVVAVAVSDAAGGLAGCLVLHALPFETLRAGHLADLAEIAAWLAPLLPDAQRHAHQPAGRVA